MPDTPLMDQRRITEQYPDFLKLRNATRAKLRRSLRRYVRDLRSGLPNAAHQEGRRDYRQAVSLKKPRIASPDPARSRQALYGAAQLRDALARYPTSVLKESLAEHLHTDVPAKKRGEQATQYRDRILDTLTAWGKQQPVSGALDPAAYEQVKQKYAQP